MVPRKKLNLIDILKTILNTKNEIKDIINTDNQSVGLNNDFAKYAYIVYNYLAEKYNQGYVSGYADYYQENVGTSRYPAEPLLYQYYLPISGSNYDPYSVDGLTDIMRDNLGFREDIRDSIAEFSQNIDNEFVTYPEYLKFLKDSLYSSGYTDGQTAASETIIAQETVEAPSADYDDNTFSMEPTQEYQVLWFKVGENGVEIRYENPVYVPYDCTIYYWSTIGQAISDGDKNAHWIECEYVPPVSEPQPKPFILPPEITFDNKKIFLKNVNEENTTIEYCINPEEEDSEWKQYLGPINIDSEMDKIAVRSYSREGILSTVDTVNVPQSQETGDPEQPTIELVPPEKVMCEYDFDNKTVVLSCPTQGAGIQYVIDSGDWIEYTNSFTIPQRIVILYTRSYIDYGEYGIYYTTNAYRLSGYTLDLREPNISTLSDGKVYISTGLAGSTIKYAVTDNEDDPITSWNTINGSKGSFFVDDDKWIHAKTVYNSRESDITHYYYNWYSTTYNLDPPTYTFENNYLMISSPYSVYYTTDGSDPRYNRENVWSGALAIYGLPITSTTTVRATAFFYDETEDYTHYSETVTWILTPSEEVNPENEYFYVKRATGISISGTYLNWSYDKVNWTNFSTCTGLDPTQTVYIRSQANGVDNLGTFSFEGTNVEVGGNIISLFRGANYMGNQDLNPSLRALFKNCTNLSSTYDLVIPNTTCNDNQYYEMFSGCTSLVTGPKQFNFTTIGRHGCEYMFKGCTSLQTTPTMTITSIQQLGCNEMFSGCTSLFTSNINLVLDRADTQSCLNMYDGCSQLSFVNMTVNENCELSSECFKYMFRNANCVNHNIKLNATTLVSKCYIQMFSGSGITRFTNLPATVMADMCYWRMFENCTQLWQFGNIEATTLATGCMGGMFAGCIRLENAPVLKAQTLVTQCYNYMFDGCSKLNFIKATFLTDPLVVDDYPYTYHWVNGVADTGVFVQNADAEWFDKGINSIPVNWTVEGSGISTGTIQSITVNVDEVTIYASTDDQIQYQFNSQDGSWIDYNGPFYMTSQSATIYARCINARGIPGTVFSQNISCGNFPVIPINVNGNIITLQNPNNIYANVYYQWEEYGGGNSGPWFLYSSPIDMGYGKQGRLNVRGITRGGVIGGTTYRDIQTVEQNTIPTPTISMSNNKVYITGNGSYGIRYSKDGSTWYDYSAPIDILENDSYIMYAFCIDRYTGRISEEKAQLYIYYQQGQSKVETPTITCDNNIVTIICATDGATIYYTTDGSTPTTSSTIYTSSITISVTTTFKAIGVKSGWITSDIQTQECQYVAPHDYSRDFFTIRSNNDGGYVYINLEYHLFVNQELEQYIYVRKNGGTWYNLSTCAEWHLDRNDTIEFKNTSNQVKVFRVVDEYLTNINQPTINLSGSSGSYTVYGNISSLIKKSSSDSEYDGGDLNLDYNWFKYCFASLFIDQTSLYSAKNLVLGTRTKWCYYQLFKGCTNMIWPPESINIYHATYSFEGICSDMFNSCTNLGNVPTGSQPISIELPSTVTYPYCYKSMFEGCTSLTTAPELPSEILTEHCYIHMFYNSGVNYIKCLATDISATDCTYAWVYEVNDSGTFIKDPNTTWPTGISGIPSSWTVQDAS